MLHKVNAFKVSMYDINRDTGYNSLTSEYIRDNYKKAFTTKRYLLNQLTASEKQSTNIVIDEVVLLK